MKMIYLLCLTVALYSSLSEGRSHKSGFQAEVYSTITELGKYYDGIRGCYNAGITTAQTVSSLPSQDAFFAVILINMYSRDCRLFRDRDELFYRKLNQELRNATGGPETKLWLKVGKLVNKAIEILGIETFNVVYRGVTYYPENRQPFSFRSITSTSKKAEVAREDFGVGGVTLIQIKDARGLDMRNYSEFPYEEEVLLRSTDTYLIDKYTRNATEIRQELNKIDPKLREVKLFVSLKRRKSFISRVLSKLFRRRNT